MKQMPLIITTWRISSSRDARTCNKVNDKEIHKISYVIFFQIFFDLFHDVFLRRWWRNVYAGEINLCANCLHFVCDPISDVFRSKSSYFFAHLHPRRRRVVPIATENMIVGENLKKLSFNSTLSDTAIKRPFLSMNNSIKNKLWIEKQTMAWLFWKKACCRLFLQHRWVKADVRPKHLNPC